MDKKYKSQDAEIGLMMTLWLRVGNVSKSGCDLPLGRLLSVYQDLTDLPGSGPQKRMKEKGTTTMIINHSIIHEIFV